MQYQVPWEGVEVWKQAVVGIVGLEDVLFNRFFQSILFFFGEVSQFEIVWESYFFDWPILSNELRLHVLLLLQGVGSQLALSHFASFTWGVRYSECHPFAQGQVIVVLLRQRCHVRSDNMNCFMLLAGVPSWLTDAELRKHASQFGQVCETFA